MMSIDVQCIALQTFLKGIQLRRIHIQNILIDLSPLYVLLVATSALLFVILQHPPLYIIDIGTPNDAPFIKNFFLPEIQSGNTFRWSEPVAELTLHGTGARPFILGLRINGDVRAQLKDREVRLNRGEQTLAVMTMEQGWRRYDVLLPARVTVGSAITTAPLQLISTAYIHEHRDLGVPIDWVSITSTSALPNPWIVSLQRSLLFTVGLGGVAIVCWYIDRFVWRRRDRLKRSLIVCLPVGICAAIILFWAQHNPFTLSGFFPVNLMLGCIAFTYLIPAWMHEAIVLEADRQGAKHLTISREWGLSDTALFCNVSTRNKQRDSLGKRLLWYVLYFLFAVVFTLFYRARTREYEDATLQSLASFNAFVPYQYRILVPAFAHVFNVIIPLEYVYILTIVVFVFGVMVLFRELLAGFIFGYLTYIYAILILYPMLWNYSILSIFIYPSDIPAIFFFVACTLCMMRCNWRLYYILFILATFNRETSCFIVFTYVFVVFGRQTYRQLVVNVIFQFSIWMIIKYILSIIFISNYGDRVFQYQGLHNWEWFVSLLTLRPAALLSLMTFGGLWMFLPINWNHQPEFLKRLLLTVIPFLIGMSIVGLLSEARIYSELVPIVTLLIAYSIHISLQRYAFKSEKYVV